MRLGLKLNGRVILDSLLDRDFNELVEGVELLSHETFISKVCINHQPARLIPVALGERRLGIVVIHGAWVSVRGVVSDTHSGQQRRYKMHKSRDSVLRLIKLDEPRQREETCRRYPRVYTNHILVSARF